MWWQLGLSARRRTRQAGATAAFSPIKNRQKSRRCNPEHKVQGERGYPIRWVNTRSMTRPRPPLIPAAALN